MKLVITIAGWAAIVLAVLYIAKWAHQPIYKFFGAAFAALSLLVTLLFGVHPWNSAPDPAALSTQHVTFTEPDEGDHVNLCVPRIDGTGEAVKGSSLWLLIHGTENTSYYLASRVPEDPDGEGWSVGTIQIGSVDALAGKHFELVIWQFDAALTEIATHFTANTTEFNSRPPGAQQVAKRTVERKAATEKDRC